MKRPPSRDTLRHLLLLIRSDARVNGPKPWRSRGFATLLRYRVRHARKFGGWTCRLFLLPVDLLLSLRRPSDAEIPSSARIGPGLHLPHPQGVIVAQGCRIGPHAAIFQQVTLGGWETGIPRVKGRAVIYAGAKVFGNVTIGRRAFVGANAVVTADVPPWHAAMGVPARNTRRSDGKAAASTAFLLGES
jgi:serine O-acetyltransferase